MMLYIIVINITKYDRDIIYIIYMSLSHSHITWWNIIETTRKT